MFFFNQTDETGAGSTVWCGNIVADKDIIELVRIYNLAGISVRPVDLFSEETFHIFGALFQIQKINF